MEGKEENAEEGLIEESKLFDLSQVTSLNQNWIYVSFKYYRKFIVFKHRINKLS